MHNTHKHSNTRKEQFRCALGVLQVTTRKHEPLREKGRCIHRRALCTHTLRLRATPSYFGIIQSLLVGLLSIQTTQIMALVKNTSMHSCHGVPEPPTSVTEFQWSGNHGTVDAKRASYSWKAPFVSLHVRDLSIDILVMIWGVPGLEGISGIPQWCPRRTQGRWPAVRREWEAQNPSALQRAEIHSTKWAVAPATVRVPTEIYSRAKPTYPNKFRGRPRAASESTSFHKNGVQESWRHQKRSGKEMRRM